MSEYIHKSHEEVDKTLRETCEEIGKRYEIIFLEIGTEVDHVHFLEQSIPTYSPTKIVTTIKSITAREIFKRNPEVKKQLWGGEFWSDGHFVSTVGKHGNEETITNYVRAQGREGKCKRLYKITDDRQLSLFD
jgi:REP element-mobilizing transposase RayT